MSVEDVQDLEIDPEDREVEIGEEVEAEREKEAGHLVENVTGNGLHYQ